MTLQNLMKQVLLMKLRGIMIVGIYDHVKHFGEYLLLKSTTNDLMFKN